MLSIWDNTDGLISSHQLPFYQKIKGLDKALISRHTSRKLKQPKTLCGCKKRSWGKLTISARLGGERKGNYWPGCLVKGDQNYNSNFV